MKVRATHKMHDFDFGCNTFMLGQYDDEEKNELYKEKWVRLFNTGVIPFYWEGTEPRQGYLRYDADTPNDVYRRPPVDAVCGFLEENGKKLKGHPLFWHEFIPAWLPKDFEELKPLVEKRFAEISERYAGRVPTFDCVNEPTRVWGVDIEHRNDGWPHFVPPKNYCQWVFELGKKYFPDNDLILNDTVAASFTEFHGTYSAFYLNIQDLLSKGAKIDRIGLQCHLGPDGFRNVYDASRLYQVLDTYADFGKPLVISEISIPSIFGGISDQELQRDAAVMLYKVCFSHPMVNGVFWWNMTDDGILTTKKRFAPGENLPSQGLVDFDYKQKLAYDALDDLINREWRTDVEAVTDGSGCVSFRGFTGDYEISAGDGRNTVSLTGASPEVTVSAG